jgi:citrate lyase subunit beta-like protein
VIHPGQIEVAQNAFMPSKQKIEWATGLVDAFNLHQKNGSGAFTYNGAMIDMPSLLQAKNILALVQKIKKE